MYEGFDINPDGSYNFWFGYLNRNFEEDVDLPATPTTASNLAVPIVVNPRTSKCAGTGRVPGDGAERLPRTQRLTWTLNVHNQALSVQGSLDSVWRIDRMRTTRGGNVNDINSNLPPKVDVTPDAKTVAAGRPLTLNISATDDGRPEESTTAPTLSA